MLERAMDRSDKGVPYMGSTANNVVYDIQQDREITCNLLTSDILLHSIIQTVALPEPSPALVPIKYQLFHVLVVRDPKTPNQPSTFLLLN